MAEKEPKNGPLSQQEVAEIMALLDKNQGLAQERTALDKERIEALAKALLSSGKLIKGYNKEFNTIITVL